MTVEEALKRVRVAFDKAQEAGRGDVWFVLSGRDGQNYENFVLALLGYTNTLELEVKFFEQLVEDYLQKDDLW